MLIDPTSLEDNLDRVEEIEKASLRVVVQALCDFRVTATEIFLLEKDLAQDKAEDITREALDRMGVSKIDVRLFGKVDYKRARYVFHPEYAIRQALFVDSKAEKGAVTTARVQVAQTSMRILQIRQGNQIDIAGKLPVWLESGFGRLLTTTVFAKYHYAEDEGQHRLLGITVAALPSGLLQDRYNPTALDTIWVVGPDAPSLDEDFRTRLSFRLLANKQIWRVQKIPMLPQPFLWVPP